MSSTTLLPHTQSKWLLATGLAVLGAASFGEAVYAFQTASQAQTIEIAGVNVPFDAVVKTVIALGAGVFGAVGLPVSIALWRRGGKTRRWQNQARLGFGLAAVAILISVGNLSGYFAYTRSQANAEIAAASPLYVAAIAKAERGETLARYEREALDAAQVSATAQRDLGDLFKAALAYGLIVACGAAYTLPRERQATRRRSRNKKAEAATPKARKPRLATVNGDLFE